MNKEQQILQELIAERKRIDDLIKRYESGGEDKQPLSRITINDSFDPMNLPNGDRVHRERYVTKTVTITNINNDYRHVENHIHNHHTNTNISIGDSAISVVGGLIRNIFE